MPEAPRKPMTGMLVSGILVLALLFAAQAVFAPLFFALFIIAIVWPCQLALQTRLPRLLALLITLIITIGFIVAIGSSLAWGLGRLGQWLFMNADRLQATYSAVVDWLEQHGIAIAGPIGDWFDVTRLLSVLQSTAGRLNSFGGFTLLVLIFVMLGLLEVEDFAVRLGLPATQPHGQIILAASRIIAMKFRRFMLVRTFASILTGLLVWLLSIGAGLELAAAWGVIAFAFNYIPFLGPLVATTLPTLFAIAQFDTWQPALLIFVSLNLIQFVIGSYLEPRLAGASLAISPFAVIFSVFFWSFMWGLAGAFIGVPILITFIVFCSMVASTTWLATVLSDSETANSDG
ncbi:AI-2E family transporter [Agrobacterium tumefaciens]|jgi:predicted PurR-regulated permease PerM|uniref:AI-2E family transporter n=1 Tax=Agrobacterium TaxID=357 RepID=UPI000DD829E5|nr:AI-2E family transporter [Agrobacterium tumefaciens]NTE68852.1 AI-2E family transporter [Agrobacterium tumefaciens]